MAWAPSKAYDEKIVAGRFIHAETRKDFEYSKPIEGGFKPFPGYDRQIWVGPLQETRWAKVLETVAYIVVDEAADGSPVTEKWDIRGHRHYAI